MALNINGTTGISGVDGSASAPAVTGTDSNTGINFASDTVNINTGGSTRATVDSSGNIGVGETTPLAKLHVKSADSGASVATYADELVVEGSVDSGITILSGNNKDGSLAFGDDGNNVAGRVVYTHPEDAMQFFTNASERMRILSSGKICFNRTGVFNMGSDPVDHNFEQVETNAYTLGLHADQTNQRGIGIYYTNGKTADPFFLSRIGNSLKTIIRGDGDLENANNSYGSISDVSMKENIVDANSQWNDIKNIKVRNYNFKASTGQQTHTQIGVIAQELESVSPKLVRESEDGVKTVSYSILYMKAVKALQEAQTRIETLEAKVAALEGA